MKNALIILSTIFLSSCVSISKGGFHPPFDGYQPNKLQYVAPISGEASEMYVFGIGGDYSGPGQYAKALDNLKRKHQLSKNQTLINITYDTKVSWFIFPILWVEKKTTVTADIIEFYREGFTERIISSDLNPIESSTISNTITEFDTTNFKNTIKKGDHILLETKHDTFRAVFVSHNGDMFSIISDTKEWVYYYNEVISVKLIPATEE